MVVSKSQQKREEAVKPSIIEVKRKRVEALRNIPQKSQKEIDELRKLEGEIEMLVNQTSK